MLYLWVLLTCFIRGLLAVIAGDRGPGFVVLRAFVSCLHTLGLPRGVLSQCATASIFMGIIALGCRTSGDIVCRRILSHPLFVC